METVSEYLGVWCPTCREDCLPIHGKCGFCDTPVDENAPNARERGATVEPCKVDGCANNSAGKGGPWRGMCSEHISGEMSRRHAKRTAAAKPKKNHPASPKANGRTNVAVPMRVLTPRAERVLELADRLDGLRIELQSVEDKYRAALQELAAASA